MDLEQARRQAWQQQIEFLLGKREKGPVQPYTVEESDALDRMLKEHLMNQGYKDDLENPEIAFLNRLLKIGSKEATSGQMTAPPLPEKKVENELDDFIGGIGRRYNTFIGR